MGEDDGGLLVTCTHGPGKDARLTAHRKVALKTEQSKIILLLKVKAFVNSDTFLLLHVSVNNHNLQMHTLRTVIASSCISYPLLCNALKRN